jgi:SAM-dependent methyltransferase
MDPGFDAAADRYDEDEAGNPVLAQMRAWSMERMEEAFPKGTRLLELGSGTGTEAARLAAGGRRIALLDVSPRLLRRAAEKVERASPGALLGTHNLAARYLERLVSTYGARTFQGLYSSFGALNCEADLAPVAAGASKLLGPGGRVVVSIINRYYPAEMAWFLAHGELSDALRRLRRFTQARAYPGGPLDVPTWYYSCRDVEAAFKPYFDTVRLEALPLLWPPPYLDGVVRRHPGLFEALRPVDRALSRLPVLRGLGDHFLLSMVRR